jgi:hypothetical protein
LPALIKTWELDEETNSQFQTNNSLPYCFEVIATFLLSLSLEFVEESGR